MEFVLLTVPISLLICLLDFFLHYTRYDYLTFTDSAGTKIQYDDTYGCDRWPKVSHVTFC